MFKKSILISFLALHLICGAQTTISEELDSPVDTADAPAIPEGAESVVFASRATASDTLKSKLERSQENDPVVLMWEDLLPEGGQEALRQEYEQFYAMLQQRYAAKTNTTLDVSMSGIAEGSELDYMPQLGSSETVDELDGVQVRVPGYIVPFRFNFKMRHDEFLLVPTLGACIHMPPPPPNQIIFVTANQPARIKDIWTPYWIEGELMTQGNENHLGDSAYTLELSRIEEYQIQ